MNFGKLNTTTSLVETIYDAVFVLVHVKTSYFKNSYDAYGLSF